MRRLVLVAVAATIVADELIANISHRVYAHVAGAS